MSSSRRPWPAYAGQYAAVWLDGGRHTSWLHKVQQHVHPVVPEARVSLDPALLGEDVVVLPLQIARNLAKRLLVVHIVAEARRVNDGQADARAFLIELELDGDGLDLDLLLEVCRRWVVVVTGLRGARVGAEHGATAEGVDEGGAAGA